MNQHQAPQMSTREDRMTSAHQRRPRVKEHIDFFFSPCFLLTEIVVSMRRRGLSVPSLLLIGGWTESPADAPGGLSGKHVATSRFTFENTELCPLVSVKISGTAALVSLLIILLQDNIKLLICAKRNILFILPQPIISCVLCV